MRAERSCTGGIRVTGRIRISLPLALRSLDEIKIFRYHPQAREFSPRRRVLSNAMLRDDYLFRQIEKLGALIQRMLRKKQEHQLEEALGDADVVLEEVFRTH